MLATWASHVALKVGLLAVGVLLAIVVPSSGRAGDFIRLGSPIGSPVNLNGIASIYNGDTKHYEAWAVGEKLNADGTTTGNGVILHYTGSYWTYIRFDTEIPVLRAVSGVRYLRTQNEDATAASATWSTIAWAVGDDGAIYRLSPYTGAWRAEKQLYTREDEGHPWVAQGRSCLDTELAGDTANTLIECRYWTTSDLKTVSAYSNTSAHLGGGPVAGVGTMMYYNEYFIQNPTQTGYVRNSYWRSENQAVLGNSTVTAITMIDSEHQWIAGYSTGGAGKIWRLTNLDGFKEVQSVPNVKFTSIAAALRNGASASNQPLTSVVWLGATDWGGTNGYVYRYDEANSATPLTLQYSGAQPITSITLARKQTGANQNLLKNGTFTADRQDNGTLNRVPDGWTVSGQYGNPRTPTITMFASALLPATGGNIYVGAPWQATTTSQTLPTMSHYISHIATPGSTDVMGPYPFTTTMLLGFSSLPTYTLQLQESDVSAGMLKSLATSSSGTFSSANGGSGAIQFGAYVQGFVKIDQFGANYQFRVVSPNGKAQLFIEQDIAQSQATLCYGGFRNGLSCNYLNGDQDCVNGVSDGVCRGTTYHSGTISSAISSVNPPLTAALTPGECRNEPQRYCSAGINAGDPCSATAGTYVCDSLSGSLAGTLCVRGSTTCAPGSCITQTLYQCPKNPAGTCFIGHCTGDAGIVCTNDAYDTTCSDAGAGTCGLTACSSNISCTSGDTELGSDACINPTPICTSSHVTSCFDDAECLMGSCEIDTVAGDGSSLSLSRCKTDADCGIRGNDISYKCQPWGICSGGDRNGLSCIQYGTNDTARITRDPNADCTGGTCVVQTIGLCQQSSTTTKAPTKNGYIDGAGGTASTTPAVSFTGNGIKSRECVGGTSPGQSCYDSSQCGGGTCEIVQTGWYPFLIQYYQLNAAQCVGSAAAGRSCFSNSACSGGACRNMPWCVGGINSGKLCDANADGTTNAGGDRSIACTANGGHCALQYAVTQTDRGVNPNMAPGVCVDSTRTYEDEACWTDTDCVRTGVYDHGKCALQAKYNGAGGTPYDAANGAQLRLQWKRPGDTVWSDVPSTNLMSSSRATNSTLITQEVPLTNVQGNTFRIEGYYKVDFPNYITSCSSNPSGGPCYQVDDPRLKVTPHAGIRVSCKNSGSFCGYDVNTLISDPAHGVIGTVDGVAGTGRCSTDPGITCTTNSECGTNGYCSVTTVVDGGWQKFSLTLSKQQRDAYGVRVADDGSQSLVVGCFADVGAEVFCKDISVTMVNSAAAVDLDTVDLLAVDDGGNIIRATDNVAAVPPNEAWTVQQSPSGSTTLNSVTSPDPYHYWIAGDQPADGGLITLLTLNPGNATGWAWMGATSASGSSDPIGWIDFNCGNLGTCQSQPSSFGVNIGDPRVRGVCSNNLTVSCTSTAMPGGCGTCIGAITGSAWLGNRDTEEKVDYGPCQNAITTSARTCSGDSTKSCTGDGTCAALGAGYCQVALYPVAVGCASSSGGTFLYCTGSHTERLCVGTAPSNCYGLCAKNQGFKCVDDSQCIVSCSQNPAACRTAGWLSFDRAVTGDPPDDPYRTTGAATPLATFDVTNGSISGWARLQLGVCTDDGSKACYKDADCGGSVCTYKNAASWASCIATAGNTEATCNASVGWVKFRTTSPANITQNVPGSFYQCTGCEDASCDICTNTDTAYPLCNGCTGCTSKRCSEDPHISCSTNQQCADAGQGECRDFGYCTAADAAAGSTDYCFANDDCASGACLFGGVCTDRCTACTTYGVSVDYDDTKSFTGYAYSPDVGWISFDDVRIGGTQYLQTQYGDIYSGGDIGSSSTNKAPGFPGGYGTSANLCNATYRLVAAGTITNFCTNAPSTGTDTDPFRQEYSALYPMPSSDNAQTTQIGTFDYDGLVTVVKTVNGKKLNKYGNEVVETPDSATYELSDPALLNITNCNKPCGVRLGGKVYHVKGSLDIEKDYVILSGSTNASGTIIVDHDISIGGNIDYEVSNLLSTVSQLPSVAFIAKGNIEIPCFVSTIKGTYYAEGTIHALSEASCDQQLTVSGVMVADRFDIQREYTGNVGTDEPAMRVIYDGRLQVNTPPGLSTFTNGIMDIQNIGQ